MARSRKRGREMPDRPGLARAAVATLTHREWYELVYDEMTRRGGDGELLSYVVVVEAIVGTDEGDQRTRLFPVTPTGYVDSAHLIETMDTAARAARLLASVEDDDGLVGE